MPWRRQEDHQKWHDQSHECVPVTCFAFSVSQHELRIQKRTFLFSSAGKQEIFWQRPLQADASHSVLAAVSDTVQPFCPSFAGFGWTQMPGKQHLDSVTGADVYKTPILMKSLVLLFLKGKRVRFEVNFPLPRVEPRMKQRRFKLVGGWKEEELKLACF